MFRRGCALLAIAGVGSFARPVCAQSASRLEAHSPASSSAGAEGRSNVAESSAPEPPPPFRPDVYPPPDARVRTLLLGGGLLVAGYGLAVGTSYLWDGAPGMTDLRTPVIGPVLAIGQSGCGPDEGASCSTVTVVLRALLAGIAGVAQVGGLGVLTEGVVMKTRDSAPVARSHQWYALPTATKSGAGLCVGATF